ncbi:MAG: lipopolysaccharide biosynthesis protein [Rhizobiaceae bacterium]
MTRPAEFIARYREHMTAYLSAISGSLGRLVFSLAYFLVLANTLPLADFGVFATASAAGVMISRLLAFGFVSPLYRVATVKPQLVGTYTAGFLALALVSVPLIGVATLAAHAMFFARDMALPVFVLVIAAETLLWRPAEVVVIVNNGMNRFGRGAALTILGTAMRAAAALALAAMPAPGLDSWAWLYLGANALSLIVGVMLWYPRQRLRFRAALYLRRWRDSLFVALSEMVFYVQMELDKLLVLSLGGATLAGIYAIVMRLIDLTAIPIRTFSMMLVQRIMRTPELIASMRRRIQIEAGIMAVSTAGLLALAAILFLFPNALGRSVAPAAGIVGLALLVPGFRNLVEYQAELLYARGQTGLRALILAGLAVLKGALLSLLLAQPWPAETLVAWLNLLFAGLYIASTLGVHPALRRNSRAL